MNCVCLRGYSCSTLCHRKVPVSPLQLSKRATKHSKTHGYETVTVLDFCWRFSMANHWFSDVCHSALSPQPNRSPSESHDVWKPVVLLLLACVIHMNVLDIHGTWLFIGEPIWQSSCYLFQTAQKCMELHRVWRWYALWLVNLFLQSGFH